MKYNLEQIKQKIGEQEILRIAQQSGFQKRKPRKIDGVSFVLGFFLLVQMGKTGLKDWAKSIGRLTGHLVSKQGLQKKLQFRHEAFARQLLSWAVQQSAHKDGHKQIDLFKVFSHVYLEDSTCLGLPRSLAPFYPGPHSHTHESCATARIQLRMELLSETYEGIWLESYRNNDQSFAPRIVDILSPGCLVIRDMGYFSLACFRAIMGKMSFFLSRWRYGTKVFDPKTQEDLDLVKQLRLLKKKGKQVLDREVLLGKKEKLSVRLVAIEAPLKIARARRYKAKKDRSAKAAHSKAYMELLGWTIFITNVGEQTWGPKDILKAYRFRWRIEIIFKCWKHKLNLDKLFDGKGLLTPPRVTITIYLMLVWLTLTVGTWYSYFVHQVYQQKQKFLSVLMFADFVRERFWELLLAKQYHPFIDELARYYAHEKRKSRKCYLEFLYESKLS